MFKDTDSLVYEIETDDVYEDFYENKNLFDFSDYPEDSKFFDPVNKKVIVNVCFTFWAKWLLWMQHKFGVFPIYKLDYHTFIINWCCGNWWQAVANGDNLQYMKDLLRC